MLPILLSNEGVVPLQTARERLQNPQAIAVKLDEI